MFDETEPPLDDFRSLGVSGALQSFEPRSGNSLADSAKIRFKTPLWMAEYRQSGLRIAIGFSSYKFDNDSRSEFTLAAETVTDLPLLTGSSGANFFLPVVFSTNFVQATGATNSTKDFNLADIGVGAGLKFKQASRDFEIQLTGFGVLYYSTEGFSIESGSSTAVVGEVQVLLREIIGEGMIAGYRIESENWSISGGAMNYSRLFHGPFIGIFF